MKIPRLHGHHLFPLLLTWLMSACSSHSDDKQIIVRGATTPTSTSFRLLGKPPKNSTWWLLDAKQQRQRLTPTADGILHLTHLQAGASYQLYQQQQLRLQFKQPTPTNNPVLFMGSCLERPFGGLNDTILKSLFQQAQQQAQSLMLWLGDTIYFQKSDLENLQSLNAAWDKQFSNPALQAILQSMPNYAIWDDHDFALNDADMTFANAALSRQSFVQHWANPSSAITQPALLNYKFSYGSVEVFVLDNRSQRAPLHHKQSKSVFGDKQLQWLKASLLASNAPFKLVVNGGQFWTDDNEEEGWQHAWFERSQFIDWLKQHPLSGLLFISGDRHHTTLFSRQLAANLTVHELTCSALTSTPEPANPSGYREVKRWFTVSENNFCRISFDEAHRLVKVHVYDETGKELAKHNLALAKP